MLYDWLGGMAGDVPALNVFRYITFRTGGATVTALLITFLFGPRIIALLRARQRRGQPIREDGPQTHIIQKQGTPTMGGFLILVGLVPSVLLWADWSNHYVWIVLFVTLGFGAVGFADDYLKVSKISPKGVPGRVKLLFEFAIALVAMWALVLASSEPLQTALTVPFFKTVLIQMGGFFFLFGALTILLYSLKLLVFHSLLLLFPCFYLEFSLFENFKFSFFLCNNFFLCNKSLKTIFQNLGL